ncbi:putative Zn(2)-C6 fungal-type domain-containing protein [Seiridium unicorne]|uniref:Zn(2)-C6 fungal-type domain-containing protein n=1 Tax=Seiridium unicorne TaxID=138068 RepID=A0ABR2VF43_9PEZI
MSVYVITGVSKGIGFELVKQISEDPNNLVVGLVRDRVTTQKKVANELGDRSNVHILHGDLTSHASLKQAAADTAKIVGERGIDYLVANGAFPSLFDAYDPIGALADKADELDDVSAKLFQTNVVGNIHLFNVFLPLVLKGKVKKVIAISSGHGDLDFINDLEVEISALYSASKAAMNVVVAKFNAQYKKDGVLFLSMSPGVVEVGHFQNATPEQIQGVMGFMGKLATYAPHFKGPTPVEEAIPIIRSTWEKASIESGYGDHAMSCDGVKSNCTKCSRSHRKCQGLRLSWPRANDHRRAVVSKSRPPSLSPLTCLITDARFVHMSNWDVELHHSLAGSVPERTLSLLDVPTIWNPSKLEALDQDLFEYFCLVASSSLASFSHDATTVGNVLARIALEGETASAVAVRQALLAFSSLHRYGLHAHAIQLKIDALGSLSRSAAPSLGVKETIQHIATGILLISFEVHQSSCTSGQWTGYLSGVKTVLNASSTKTLLQFDSDVAALLDFVHYHDVLAHFSLFHWTGEAPEVPPTPTDLFCSQPTAPYLLHAKPVVSNNSEDILNEATLIVQLYQLALLVYLNRSSEGLMNQTVGIKEHIDRAFAIFSRLSSCKQQFPIHIIGCEARDDEQRAVVLDLIARTEKTNSSRSFHYCKKILQAVWAQDDLAYGNSIGYRDKLISIMSRCKVVPSFV